MSSRLNRIWLLPLLLLGSQAWALGLGEIRLSSALNQPMYAEIELLSATPEELNNLTIQMASAETFDRYDLDRPLFLTRLNFEVVESDRVDGNVIRVTSSDRVSGRSFVVSRPIAARIHIVIRSADVCATPGIAGNPNRHRTQSCDTVGCRANSSCRASTGTAVQPANISPFAAACCSRAAE